MLLVFLLYLIEIVFLNVYNGICVRMDKKEVILFVFFDLSFVFDIIDYGFILDIFWRFVRSCSEENLGLYC